MCQNMSYRPRPFVTEKNYNKIIKLADLPFDCAFDKALSAVLLNLENSRGKKQ